MDNKIHVWNHQAVLMLTNSRYKKRQANTLVQYFCDSHHPKVKVMIRHGNFVGVAKCLKSSTSWAWLKINWHYKKGSFWDDAHLKKKHLFAGILLAQCHRTSTWHRDDYGMMRSKNGKNGPMSRSFFRTILLTSIHVFWLMAYDTKYFCIYIYCIITDIFFRNLVVSSQLKNISSSIPIMMPFLGKMKHACNYQPVNMLDMFKITTLW